LPEPYARGDYKRFSWDSAWWVTNLVSNLAYDRWSRVFPDIQKAQQDQESSLLKMQPVIEETAARLESTDPALMSKFLTTYSVSTGEEVFHRWQELMESILTKNVDGYVKDPTGRPKAPGYSKEWLEHVVKSRPEQFKLPENHRPVETDH
jgi:dipeptidase